MKKMVVAVLLAGMMVTAATGCSGKDKAGAPAESSVVAETQAEASETPAVESEAVAEESEAPAETQAASGEVPADAQELEGTVDEVKDSMFVIEAADGKYYPFNFGENVAVKKDELNQGEKVKLYYSGELSEVEAFTGTVYKVEAVK